MDFDLNPHLKSLHKYLCVYHLPSYTNLIHWNNPRNEVGDAIIVAKPWRALAKNSAKTYS